MLHISVLSHGSEGCRARVCNSIELYISVISHGSEGSSSEDVLSEKLQYSTDLDGSEGSMLWIVIFTWFGYFLCWKSDN